MCFFQKLMFSQHFDGGSQPLKVHTIHQYCGTLSQVLCLFFPVSSLTSHRVLPALAFNKSLPLKSATWQFYIARDLSKSHVDITSNHESQKMNQEAPSMGFYFQHHQIKVYLLFLTIIRLLRHL